MPCGEALDLVHLGGDAGVVDGHDRLRALAHRGRDQPLVEVQRVAPDVDEADVRPPEPERVRGGDVGEGRHDHLVPGLEVAEDGRDLERRGARVGQDHLGGAEGILHPLGALLGEPTLVRQPAVEHGPRDVEEFLPDDEGAIEGDPRRHRDGSPNARRAVVASWR
jgi:hypothetical protein